MDNAKIRILHIVGSLNVGGAETMIVNIFRHIDRDRFDFSFLVNGSRGGYYEKAVQQLGGSVDYLPKRRQSLLRTVPDHQKRPLPCHTFSHTKCLFNQYTAYCCQAGGGKMHCSTLA